MAKRLFKVDIELGENSKIVFPDLTTQNSRPNYTTRQTLNSSGNIVEDITLITGGTTFTLPAIGSGRIKRIINASANIISINSSGGAQIGNKPSGNPTSFKLYQQEVLDVSDDGSQWRIV